MAVGEEAGVCGAIRRVCGALASTHTPSTTSHHTSTRTKASANKAPKMQLGLMLWGWACRCCKTVAMINLHLRPCLAPCTAVHCFFCEETHLECVQLQGWEALNVHEEGSHVCWESVVAAAEGV